MVVIVEIILYSKTTRAHTRAQTMLHQSCDTDRSLLAFARAISRASAKEPSAKSQGSAVENASPAVKQSMATQHGSVVWCKRHASTSYVLFQRVNAPH